MVNANTREKAITAASELFYRQGFEATSFLHIARQLGISKGNLYHHFKSKQELLNAVIGHRLCDTQNMLQSWEASSEEPQERIKCYINIVIQNWSKIRLYGCPVGTLSNDMLKIDPGNKDAGKVFALFRAWLRQQFSAMGYSEKSDDYAMRVLSWSQGVAVLGSSFSDLNYVEREVSNMNLWIDELHTKHACNSSAGEEI